MDNEFVKKKSIGKVLLIIFVIVAVLGGILFGGYTLLKTFILNPEKYLVVTKKMLSANIEKNFKLFNEKEKETKFSGNLSFKVDNKDLAYLNKLTIGYDAITSLDKEEMQYNYKFKEDNKELLNANLYLIKDSLYLESNDLYSKILFLQKLDINIFEEYKKLKDNDVEDAKNIINKYLDFFIEALKETKMESEMLGVYKVRYVYEINDGNREKIQSKYDELIKNDKAIQTLTSNGNFNFDIKFNNFRLEIVKSIFLGKIYSLKITDDNGEVFLLEIDSENEDLYHITAGDEKGTLTIDDNTYTLQWFENDALSFTLKLVNDDNLFRLSVTNQEIDFVTSIKKENKNTMNVTFSIKDKDNFNIDLSGTIVKNNNKYNLSFILDITQEEKIRIKLDGILEYGDNLLSNKDVSNAVDINSLNEKEQNKIYENLYKKLDGSKLLELLQSGESSFS